MPATVPSDRLHQMWAAVAPAWAEHVGYADARGAHVAERMLELAAPRPGERVLELACGPAGLGLAAAARVAPEGFVVLSDVVQEMTAIAAARAAELGVRNVSTRELDLERIDEPDGTFDVVLCREGLMFAFDPAQATAEIHRVLRRGGRMAVAVWGPRDRNPWLGIVFDAVSAELGRPVPPPGIPGPFALADAERLHRLLAAAGLVDVAVREVDVPLRSSSFDEWWTRTCALAGPLTAIMGSLPDARKAALRARVQETTSRYRAPGGLDFPGVSLIAAARRP